MPGGCSHRATSHRRTMSAFQTPGILSIKRSLERSMYSASVIGLARFRRNCAEGHSSSSEVWLCTNVPENCERNEFLGSMSTVTSRKGPLTGNVRYLEWTPAEDWATFYLRGSNPHYWLWWLWFDVLEFLPFSYSPHLALHPGNACDGPMCVGSVLANALLLIPKTVSAE